MIWIAVAAILLGIAICLCWEFLYNRRTLGKTDLSQTLHEFMWECVDGDSLTCSDLRSRAFVRFVKHVAKNDTPLMNVELHGGFLDPDQVSDFRSELKILDVPFETTSEGAPAKRLVVQVNASDVEAWKLGRVGDLALRAIGLSVGQRYRVKFRGDVDLRARQYFHSRNTR